MVYKNFRFYFALLMVGASTWALIHWDTIYAHMHRFVSLSTPIQQLEIAQHAHAEHAHAHTDEEEHHHEENLVKLTTDQIEQMGLQFKIAGSGSLFFTLSARGKIILHPDRIAHIIPKISGVAKRAYKNIGDLVKIGEVMALLESREMADVKATYLAALSRERLAASSLNREERLYREKVSAGQDFLNAKNMHEEALINALLAKQKLRAIGLTPEEIEFLADQNEPDLSLYSIRAPLDGTVILRHIMQGEFIENTKTIYEVADLSTVWVEIGIYPKDLHRVKKGQHVEILIPDEDQSSKAKIIYVSPIVAEETITAKAIAELSNAQAIWKPGVFVKVNIMTEQRAFPIVIPKTAIQTSNGKDYIFMVVPGGFEKRFVTLGMQDNENVAVLSGLQPGEEYVANKTFLLKAELGKETAEHTH